MFSISSNKKIPNKKAQVWVETVLYLLVGLAVIAAILAFVRPKIAEIQDKMILDQSVDMLKQLDENINNVWDNGEGNKKIAEVTIKKGDLIISPNENTIRYVMQDSKSIYSQINSTVQIGSVYSLTKRTGSGQSVELWLNYSNVLNISYAATMDEKTLGNAPTPYRISLTNIRPVDDNFIDIDLIS